MTLKRATLIMGDNFPVAVRQFLISLGVRLDTNVGSVAKTKYVKLIFLGRKKMKTLACFLLLIPASISMGAIEFTPANADHTDRTAAGEVGRHRGGTDGTVLRGDAIMSRSRKGSNFSAIQTTRQNRRIARSVEWVQCFCN